jgi:hypothetical protein
VKGGYIVRRRSRKHTATTTTQSAGSQTKDGTSGGLHYSSSILVWFAIKSVEVKMRESSREVRKDSYASLISSSGGAVSMMQEDIKLAP